MIGLENITRNLKDGIYKKVSFLLGAGISTSAGIPDFRSKQGRYIKLKEKFNLEDPQSFFNLKFFKNNTEVFYDYLKLTNFDSYQPTRTHLFIRFLQNKNLVNIVYTQNIDSLEEKAGIQKEKIVYAHGNINEAICSTCRKQHSVEKLRKHIQEGNIMYCDMCFSPCKYSVVLFGEPLPEAYFNNKILLKESDLVFVIGTSLLVKPFAHLINSFREDVPIIMINKEDLLERSEIKSFINNQHNLINLVGECDEVVQKLVKDVGWSDEFRTLL